MAVKTLVIDGTDRDHFFLSVESGTLRIGDAASHPEGVLRDVRVRRIRCEVEVDDDRETVPVDEPGVIAPSSLRAGEAVKLAHAELSLADDTVLDLPSLAAPPAKALELAAGDPFQLDLDLSNSQSGSESEAATTTEAPSVVERRFKVVDGGDQGRTFKLPDEATISLGRHGHADIGLNDFYVSKIHCLLHIDGYKIMVSHVEGQSGTLINGMKISVSQKLHVGSVLRIGNSHLKLEAGPFPDEPEPIKQPESEPPPPPPKKRVRAEAIKDPLLDLEGKEFGHFKLGRLLGRGFSGAVFEAVDQKTKQAVAVKVLAGEFPAAPEELNRFIAEFKTAQAVRHPNLVALLGAGKSAGHCWFSRELVAGESAAEVIQRAADGKKPSWTRAARSAVLLGRVVEVLHKRKLTHGDIEPNNILLDKETHAVKLADFKLLDGLDGSKLHAAFIEKKMLAEAAWSPPEGGISDLYSVGAVIYAMIAGKPPEGSKPPRPSKIYDRVPDEFDRVVMRLIAHDPGRRYRSATDLLTDMKPISEANDLKLS